MSDGAGWRKTVAVMSSIIISVTAVTFFVSYYASRAGSRDIGVRLSSTLKVSHNNPLQHILASTSHQFSVSNDRFVFWIPVITGPPTQCRDPDYSNARWCLSSCRLSASVTLHGGPVVLRPVRATSCWTRIVQYKVTTGPNHWITECLHRPNNWRIKLQINRDMRNTARAKYRRKYPTLTTYWKLSGCMRISTRISTKILLLWKHVHEYLSS